MLYGTNTQEDVYPTIKILTCLSQRLAVIILSYLYKLPLNVTLQALYSVNPTVTPPKKKKHQYQQRNKHGRLPQIHFVGSPSILEDLSRLPCLGASQIIRNDGSFAPSSLKVRKVG